MRHEMLAQWKICRRPTVSLCRDRSIVLPWMADQPTDSVYIIRAPTSRFICFSPSKKGSLPPAHELPNHACETSPLFWKQATKRRLKWFSRFERLDFIDEAHPINLNVCWLNSCGWAILKATAKKASKFKTRFTHWCEENWKMEVSQNLPEILLPK